MTPAKSTTDEIKSDQVRVMHLVGNKVTLADIETCQIAFTYLLNDCSHLHKEHAELLQKPEYAVINEYFVNLKQNLFKDYFTNFRRSGFPY
jgi:hypothetical protein